ncbi:MAG: LysR family transcriptional regulator [Coriobacteriales bacterium]|nr:LysR family transcriptional regulator [Coriobacteriales bacterium]
MDIRLFKEFLILAQHMNVSHAAAELHLSQPTLSRHISDLEREFGQKLFNRKRPLCLTRAGEVVLKRAGEIWDCYEELADELQALRNSISGTVRIHNMTYYPVGLESFTRAMLSLKRLYPNVSVEMVDRVVRSLKDDLADDLVDMSFIFKGGKRAYDSIPDDNIFSYSRVGNQPDHVIAGVGIKHRLASHTDLHLSDLANIRIVRPSTLLFDSPCEAFIELCQKHDIEPRYQLLSSDSLQQFWMQDFSMHVLTLAASYVDSGVFPIHMSRQIKLMEFEDDGMDWCMHGVYKKDNPNPAVAAFAEFLSEPGDVAVAALELGK